MTRNGPRDYYIECRCGACFAYFRYELVEHRDGRRVCPVCKTPEGMTWVEKKIDRRIKNE